MSESGNEGYAVRSIVDLNASGAYEEREAELASLAVLKKEKDHVILVTGEPRKDALGNKKTRNWKDVLLIDPEEMLLKFKETPPEENEEKGLYKIHQRILAEMKLAGKFPLVLCAACFRNPKVDLFSAVILVKGDKLNNIASHNKTQVGKGIPGHDEAPNETAAVVGQAQKSKGIMNSFLQNAKDLSRKELKDKLHFAVYKCVNDCGLAKSIVEQDTFREMVHTIWTHASYLKESDLPLA
jgi:hypothetical protein